MKSDVIRDVDKSNPLQQNSRPTLRECEPVQTSRSFARSDMLHSRQAVSGVANDDSVGS